MSRNGKNWSFVAAVAVVVTLAVSDVSSNAVRRYWLGHSMASAIVSGLVLVAATVLVLDDLLERRETAKYRRLATEAAVAVKDRLNEIFRVCNEHYNYGASPSRAWLPHDARAGSNVAVRERITSLAQDQGWVESVRDSTALLIREVESALTAWSPVLLQHPELVRLANRLSVLLSALRHLRMTSATVARPETVAPAFVDVVDETAATELWLYEHRPGMYRPPLWLRFKAAMRIGGQVDLMEPPDDWYETWAPPRPEDLPPGPVPGGFLMPEPRDDLQDSSTSRA